MKWVLYATDMPNIWQMCEQLYMTNTCKIFVKYVNLCQMYDEYMSSIYDGYITNVWQRLDIVQF